MTYENNPFEMGLDRLVDWDTLTDDACISIAALQAIQAAGVDRRINGVEIDGEPFPALNNVKWPCIADGARGRQGHLGDLLASPREEHRVRMAPDRAARRSGTTIEVESEWGTRGGDGRRDAVRGPEEADPGLLDRIITALDLGAAARAAVQPGAAAQALRADLRLRRVFEP